MVAGSIDYDFEYLDVPYHVEHDPGKVALIVNEEWDAVVSVYNAGHWPLGEAMPKAFAIVALAAYLDGEDVGSTNGYRRCQREMKKVLGL